MFVFFIHTAIIIVYFLPILLHDQVILTIFLFINLDIDLPDQLDPDHLYPTLNLSSQY